MRKRIKMISIRKNNNDPTTSAIVESTANITCTIMNNITGKTTRLPNCWASLVLETLDDTNTIAIVVKSPQAGDNSKTKRMKFMSSKILNPKIG